MATLYFNAATDQDWNILTNWWADSNHTIAATGLPISTDNVILDAVCDANTGSQPTVANLRVNNSYGLGINITITTMATFNDSSYNSATITGSATFNDNSYNSGIITEDAIFNNNSYNKSNITGTVTVNRKAVGIDQSKILGLPYPNPTQLLMHFSGANDSTSFIDSSPNNISIIRYGNAKISTAQSKFGNSSGYFDGIEGTYISIPRNGYLNFGSEDFAIEFWYYPTSQVDNAAILSFGWITGYFAPLLIYSGSGPNVTFYSSSDGSSWNIASSQIIIPSPSNNTWYHIAVSRYKENLRLYADGSLVSTHPISGRLMEMLGDLAICARSDGTFSTGAYIDELRITKGSAREYTGSSYTLNTSPFER